MTRFLVIVALLAPLLAKAQGFAIVLQDETPLRPTPGAAAAASAVLWQGETLEVRGERLDYLQVWDYTRERGGYVRASQVRRLALSEDETPELLAVLGFLRDLPGSEALGIGIAAAYIEAAAPEQLNGPDGVAALEAMGALAERLARQAMATRLQKAAAVSAHLDVAASYGVRFVTVEVSGRMRLCYDGAAYRKILGLHATEEQRARAMLALSDPACTRPELTLAELVGSLDEAKLPAYLRSRVLIRRAALWSSVAYQRARKGEDGAEAAERALKALAAVQASELADADRRPHAEATLRVAAVRVALARPVTAQSIHVTATAGDDGRTCVALRSAKREELARRCTHGLVWPASAVANREGTALAVAVQPLDGWRELWLFRKQKAGWTLRVLPPAPAPPGVGTAEFAGWAPGRVRVARAALVGGQLRQSVQLVRTASGP
ncbi:MAG TPA: hypothetical protein VEV21_01820 [Burkholderiales bacterium]|nr:hypothetical protein [Burkholderiales bacterium]